jgi:ATP:ADP antiporter, AAA family
MIRPSTPPSWRERVAGWLVADEAELPALISGFLLFFVLFTAYMMLRPVRETMGIAGGVDNLQWLFLGTFLATLLFVPLFGTFAALVPRRSLLPASYLFSAATLLALGLLMQFEPGNVWVGRVFYVWLSVLNLFLISVAWSLMSDTFSAEQARRMFAQLAAGASLGALAGPLLSGLLVAPIGHGGLLILSASLLLATLPFSGRLNHWSLNHPRDDERVTNPSEPIGGSIIAGLTLVARSPYLLGIALFVVLLTSVSTFLYFEQAQLIAETLPDPAEQTQLFSSIDVLVQALTLLMQLLVTARLARRLGVTVLLAAIPILMLLGFGLLLIAAALPVLLLVVVMRRVGEYALARPGREMLFTQVGQEARYKAKNVIDTVVYRGGDAISAWMRTAVDSIGGQPLIAGMALAGLWAVAGCLLGRRFDRRPAERLRIGTVERMA